MLSADFLSTLGLLRVTREVSWIVGGASSLHGMRSSPRAISARSSVESDHVSSQLMHMTSISVTVRRSSAICPRGYVTTG